jgi:prophage DNA circulation protein
MSESSKSKIAELEAQLRQEREAHARELSRYASIEEKAHLQTIDERDAAEDALSQAYYLIKGASPQWSNLFGYQQALEDVDDFQKCVRAELKTSEQQVAQLQTTISQLTEAMKEIQAIMRSSTWLDDLEKVGPICDAALVPRPAGEDKP